MSIFSLDVLRARKGDCLLLHYGTKKKPKLAIIDGGPGNVYKPFLKPRLQAIRNRRASSDEALSVDLLMVSHVDDDHIHGIIELTSELVIEHAERKPPGLKIRNFWHNSFDRLASHDADELLQSITPAAVTASLAGDIDDEDLRIETALVLASVAQGARLSDDARKLKLGNKQFGTRPAMAVDGTPLDMGDGMTFVVAGPMEKELEDLRKEYQKFLEKKRREEHVPVPASFTDTSIANLSSIVVLAEFEGKSILFTGDARGDKILEGMALTGLLDEEGKRHVNLLKVPHHGSDRNMKTCFFQNVTADHYVFSGDGEHGNPERETLQMLLDARGVQEDYIVHLTYPVYHIDAEREKDWEKERAKERARAEKAEAGGKIPKAVRGKWSAKKHGLKSFFDDNPDFHAKVQIVDENNDGSPHVIDLLDELGY